MCSFILANFDENNLNKHSMLSIRERILGNLILNVFGLLEKFKYSLTKNYEEIPIKITFLLA